MNRYFSPPQSNTDLLAAQARQNLALKTQPQQPGLGEQMIGGGLKLGTAILDYARGKQMLKYQAEQAKRKENLTLMEELVQKGRTFAPKDPARTLNDELAQGVDMLNWSMPESAPAPTKLQTSIQTRPGGTFAIQTNPLTGDVNSKLIEGVPGVPLSQNIGYMNYLDKQQQERIRLAENRWKAAAAKWDKEWIRGGRMKKGAPPRPQLEPYYQAYNISIPATTISGDSMGLYQ